MKFKVILLRDNNLNFSYYVVGLEYNKGSGYYTANIISRDHSVAFLHNGTSEIEAFENVFDEIIEEGFTIIEHGDYVPDEEYKKKYNNVLYGQ